MGVGFKLKFGRNTRGSLAVIAPMTDKISSIDNDEEDESEDIKVYFDLQSSF